MGQRLKPLQTQLVTDQAQQSKYCGSVGRVEVSFPAPPSWSRSSPRRFERLSVTAKVGGLVGGAASASSGPRGNGPSVVCRERVGTMPLNSTQCAELMIHRRRIDRTQGICATDQGEGLSLVVVLVAGLLASRGEGPRRIHEPGQPAGIPSLM
jgi:hypothetical protein